MAKRRRGMLEAITLAIHRQNATWGPADRTTRRSLRRLRLLAARRYQKPAHLGHPPAAQPEFVQPHARCSFNKHGAPNDGFSRPRQANVSGRSPKEHLPHWLASMLTALV